MTREEAIKWLSDELMFLERPNVNKGSGLEKKIAVCQMAIDAIREQEERENPKPLTLDELWKMGGEPVWIDDWFEDSHGWELSEDASDYFDGYGRTFKSYGTRWVAYRSKPKEDA